MPPLRRNYLGWGIDFFDYDNDGYQDLFIASGHVLDNIALFDQSTSYEQQNMLLRNQGPDQQGRYRFADVSNRSGAGMLLRRASRGTGTTGRGSDRSEFSRLRRAQ